MLIIPDAFWQVSYNAAAYPGAPGLVAFEQGANCQHFAYEILRHNGFLMGDLRSSDLWSDREFTEPVIGPLCPGDLLLFNARDQAWGAHVALFVGEGRAVHLTKAIGKPVIWSLDEFAEVPAYRYFIGAKRPFRKN